MRKTSQYSQMGQHLLVRRPDRRAIRVILLGQFHQMGTNYLSQLSREQAIADRAADVAYCKGWKTIIVEPDLISGRTVHGCNIDGHLAACGFNKNDVFIGHINDIV